MPQAFANLQGLVRLSRNEGVDIRPSLLRVLTDLYVQEPLHSLDEEQQYLELALRLLPAVDLPTRVAVANKLSAYGNVPAVLQEEIRRIIPNLAGHAEWQGQAADLTAGNPLPADAQPVGPVPAIRMAAAVTSSEVQSVGELFLRAAPVERETLLVRVQNEAAQAPTLLSTPPAQGETVARLEAYAMQCDPREFARELQQALGLSGRVASQVVLDDFGEPLLIVARVLAMPPEVLLRIVLFLKPSIGESVERVFALVSLYDRLDLQTAMPILASWRQAPRPASLPKYQSVLAPDTAPLVGARENTRISTDALGGRATSQPAAGRERKTS